ncbi:MAG: hypothetical protein O9267_14025 [Flavobacterium sp.]|uniref:hypothetical protein n=1 Tax=Flavobacterium sp. TaxID=239 RepID=UPI0022CBA993|nr:hypothetical protein [Flavobacterium sp.]MCZ8198717.1 hypothetical protein [Flavobacterium sp.]
MKQLAVVLFSILVLFSCQKKQEDAEACSTEDKEFKMYEMSEMAMLMEQMYAHNQQLRLRIIKGDSVGTFPDFFNKIYSAKFTTSNDNDVFFQENAKKYIDAQQLIYSESENVKENFNKGVDACITCHKGKCGGPIPRIKKLYIK